MMCGFAPGVLGSNGPVVANQSIKQASKQSISSVNPVGRSVSQPASQSVSQWSVGRKRKTHGKLNSKEPRGKEKASACLTSLKRGCGDQASITDQCVVPG